MITALLILFAVLLAAGFVGTVLVAMECDSWFFSYLAFQNAGKLAELFATVVVAIFQGLNSD